MSIGILATDSQKVDGYKMENYNPLIKDNSEDTLYQTHCLLLLLEELCAFKETDNSMGVSALLQCANHALAYEVERISKNE